MTEFGTGRKGDMQFFIYESVKKVEEERGERDRKRKDTTGDLRPVESLR